MTADSYAAAVGLVERSAAAYVSGIPDDPADDGLFGPASVTWRVSGDLARPVAGLRALMIQALHPLAMAGVDQHSDWRARPGRAGSPPRRRTWQRSASGNAAVAERAAARVRRIHEHVTGVDPVTGRPYAASDPALLLWVHAALVESGIAARELFGTPLAAGDADRYIAEMVVAAELVGVPPELRPDSRAELAHVPGLRSAPAAVHDRGQGVDGLPARPARPGRGGRARSGRTSGTARSSRCRTGPGRCTATPRRR